MPSRELQASPGDSEERISSTLQNELAQLENDYQITLDGLFAGRAVTAQGANDNPFKDELDDSGKNDSPSQGGDSSTPPANDGNPTDSGGVPDEGGESPPPDNGTPPGGEGEVPAPRFDLLVVSRYADGAAPLGVSRAFRNGLGDVTLENGLRLQLFSPLVGGLRPIFVAESSEQLVADSFYGNSRFDAFLIQASTDGSALFGLAYDVDAKWELQDVGYARYQDLRLSALFDIDSDGQNEWILGVQGGRFLSVYEFSDDGIQYSKRLSLPFVPGSLAHTSSSLPSAEQYLHVFDQEFRQSVSFTSLSPGVYSYSSPPTFKRMVRMHLDSAAGPQTGPEYVVVLYVDRVVIVSAGPVPVQIASVPVSVQLPTLVVGNVMGEGANQVIWLP